MADTKMKSRRDGGPFRPVGGEAEGVTRPSSRPPSRHDCCDLSGFPPRPPHARGSASRAHPGTGSASNGEREKHRRDRHPFASACINLTPPSRSRPPLSDLPLSATPPPRARQAQLRSPPRRPSPPPDRRRPLRPRLLPLRPPHLDPPPPTDPARSGRRTALSARRTSSRPRPPSPPPYFSLFSAGSGRPFPVRAPTGARRHGQRRTPRRPRRRALGRPGADAPPGPRRPC